MVPNPCFCGCSLQSATKIVAIVDMVFASLACLLSILVLILGLAIITDDNNTTNYTDTYIIVSSICLLLVSIFHFILAIVLLRGSRDREFRKCRIWFIVTLVLVVLTAIAFIINVTSGPDGLTIGSSVVQVVYKLFALWVVYAFMEELKLEGTNSMAAAPGGGKVYAYPPA